MTNRTDREWRHGPTTAPTILRHVSSTRSILVTGAVGGLGVAIADAAVRAGYRVGCFDLVSGSGFASPTVTSYVGSVHDAAAVNAALDDFGVPDVVVNNAGIVRFGALTELSIADWQSVIDVNLTGTFVVAQAVAKRWIATERPGVIVNITSMNGVMAGPRGGAYGATKAAVALLTSQMAIEWGPHGIRVNAVAPGLIDAGISAPIYADLETREARESKVPLGRLGTADDVARTVMFLASDDAAYITGQNILVDGGITGSVIAHLPRPPAVDGSNGSR
jgi:NAD(P)-dependent dehydrogenase (short-subunit alcohol dehydrogenase family)